MEKADIQLTDNNIDEILKADATGRNKDINHLLNFLTLQDNSWSIAIDGSWGSGKTFFVKQCQYVLDLTRSANSNKKNIDITNIDTTTINNHNFKTVYFDAWTHDSEEDPIASILKSIISTDWISTSEESFQKVLDIGLNITDLIAGTNFKKFVDNWKKQENNLDKLKQDFNKALSKLTSNNEKLIIFVDELDRCKPTYAVKVLERIKHYFNNDKVTFIISTDLYQLQNTVKRYYGEGFDGYGYLDRFFDIVFTIPEPDIEKYIEYKKSLLPSDVYNKSTFIYNFIYDLIRNFSFSIRQVNHLCLKINSATYNFIAYLSRTGSDSESFGQGLIYQFILPFMCALKQKNINAYNSFIIGKASNEILNLLSNSSALNSYFRMKVDTNKIDVKSEIEKLYHMIFTDNFTSKDAEVLIMDVIYIEHPQRYKKKLIKACSLFDDNVKYD